jgi:glyoxylase-like metal-dependent hydrolase (beta-lactamase superfamily II)
VRQIVPDVYLIQGLRVSNVYLLVTGDEWVVVDSGTAGDAGRIAEEIQQGGFALSSLRAIVLTHAHSDHTGSLLPLVRLSGAAVWAHQEEVPYVQKEYPLPAASPVMQFLLRLSDRFLSGRAAPVVDKILFDGERLSALEGLQVIHTPGHTPGSICLYQPERKLLFCGDTLFNVHPVTGKKGLRPAIRLASADMEQVHASLHKLAALDIETLFPGHGDPILEGAGDRIRSLIP